jgi:DNA (cytosine-5)-methyltransferase 1
VSVGEPFGAALNGIVALDLFAGTGWGVACQALGIEEHGVELMPEAIASREAAGMHTAYYDVWQGLEEDFASVLGWPEYPHYDLLIASPPCQTFSMAGSGKGRAALDEVLALIHSRAFLHPHELRAFGERHDPRTALVLTPLAHVARDTPRLVVFEQVPTVLPVWEACAEVMREWGYSVWTGNLQAEMYGVPQTRKRAILIARWDGEAKPPTPTHSRYYSRSPEKLDPGVLPWVSMAEALGWGRTARPSVTVTGGGTETGGAEPLGHLDREVAAPDWVMRSNYGTSGDASKRGEADRNLWLTANDRLSNAARRHVDTPAPTITGGHDSGNRKWVGADQPATTLAGDSRVWPRGHKVNADDIRRLGEEEARERYGDRAGTDSVRVTIEEAAVLQSYPADFPFQGNKGKRFLQVGNAVPPKLAEAILASLLDS